MPDVHIQNSTSSTLRVAFIIVAPVQFNNDLEPGHTIKFHLATFPHNFEARVQLESNLFSSEKSWEKGKELGIAVASGTSAVLAGTAWLFGRVPFFGGSSMALGAAGMAWSNAFAYGAKYGAGADGVVLAVPNILIPFHDKRYEIKEEGDRLVLRDMDEDRILG